MVKKPHPVKIYFNKIHNQTHEETSI